MIKIMIALAMIFMVLGFSIHAMRSDKPETNNWATTNGRSNSE